MIFANRYLRTHLPRLTDDCEYFMRHTHRIEKLTPLVILVFDPITIVELIGVHFSVETAILLERNSKRPSTSVNRTPVRNDFHGIDLFLDVFNMPFAKGLDRATLEKIPHDNFSRSIHRQDSLPIIQQDVLNKTILTFDRRVGLVTNGYNSLRLWFRNLHSRPTATSLSISVRVRDYRRRCSKEECSVAESEYVLVGNLLFVQRLLALWLCEACGRSHAGSDSADTHSVLLPTFWHLRFGIARIDVEPAIYAWPACCRPEVFTGSHKLVYTFVLLTYSNTQPLIIVNAVSCIRLCDQATSVGRVEDGEVWIGRPQRPDTCVVHGECVHASPGRNTPHFDCLITTSGQNGTAVLANEDIPNVVCVAHKLGNALPSLWIPDPDRTLWSTTREYRWRDIQRIYTALVSVQSCDSFVFAHVNTEFLACSCQIPQAHFAIEAAAGYPIRVRFRYGQDFDIIRVQTDRLWRKQIMSGRSPNFDGNVRGSGDESLVGLREGDIVDPVGVRLCLIA